MTLSSAEPGRAGPRHAARRLLRRQTTPIVTCSISYDVLADLTFGSLLPLDVETVSPAATRRARFSVSWLTAMTGSPGLSRRNFSQMTQAGAWEPDTGSEKD